MSAPTLIQVDLSVKSFRRAASFKGISITFSQARTKVVTILLTLCGLLGVSQLATAEDPVYFADANFEHSDLTFTFQMNLRYPGQNWPLTIEVSRQLGSPDFSFVGTGLHKVAVDGFNALHQSEFGHVRDNEMPEVTGVRLTTSAQTAVPPVGEGFTAPLLVPKPSKTRRANLGEGYSETAIYHGPDLKPGSEIKGPGIIEESFKTHVVYPGWKARIDDAGDYELLKMGR